jgi:RNase P/RNase MRP subunit p30
MVSVDLKAQISERAAVPAFTTVAKSLGLDGLATPLMLGAPVVQAENGVHLYSRADLSGSSLNALRKRIVQVRKQSIVVAVPLTGITINNWAAEEPRVDLITLTTNDREHTLRSSTASLAADNHKALEVQILPLLSSVGLDRSRAIKILRENVDLAVGAGMQIVISTNASRPLQLRSPAALRYIGRVLDLDDAYLEHAVNQVPEEIVRRNSRKLENGFIASGLEIVQEGEIDE